MLGHMTSSHLTPIGLVKTIPVLPEVIAELLRLLRLDTVAQAERIVALVSRDAALAAQVLHRANGASQPGAQAIRNLDQAVLVVGFGQLRAIAIFLSLARMKGDDSSGLDMRRHWISAAASAFIARRVASVVAVDPDLAFLFGLIKGAGRVMLAHYAPRESAHIIEVARSDKLSFHRAAQRSYGTTDAEWCAWLLKSWTFEPELVDAIRCQYDYEQAQSKELVITGQLAEVLCAAHGFGSPVDFAKPTCDPRAWMTIGFNTDRHLLLHHQAKQDIAEAQAFLEGFGN